MKNCNFVFKNNVSIYLVVLGDFDNFKLSKILDTLLSYYGCSIKSLWLHIQVLSDGMHRVLFLYSTNLLL